MRKLTTLSVMLCCLFAITTGCKAPAPVVPDEPYTASNNPTTLAGRGAPDLEDDKRPAAWVFIDGIGGHFIDVEGRPQVQWVIDGKVCSTPTFQVEVYEDLLGKATDFKCVLKSLDTDDGPGETYFGIAAKEGRFSAGKEYSLVAPGEDFVVRDATHTEINEIGPLAPGEYMLAAGVKNGETGKEALAITYFTVGR